MATKVKRGRPWRRIRAAVIAAAPKPLRCHWCGRVLHPVAATVDHVNALADGGSHFGPFVIACRACNSRRSARRTNAIRRGERPPEPRKGLAGFDSSLISVVLSRDHHRRRRSF